MTVLPAVRYHVENVPNELKEQRRWCVFQVLPGSKGKKTPLIAGVRPLPGVPVHAKCDDPTTWRTFDEALADAETRGLYLGFAFDRDFGMTFVDLDDAIGSDGAPTPEAQLIVDTLDSYTEVSVSGTGVHVVTGGLPSERFTKNGFAGHVEVYPRRGGRFMVVTGETRPGLGSRDGRVEERTTELAHLFPARPDNGSLHVGSHPSHTMTTRLSEADEDAIVAWAKRYWTDGRRHHMALYMSGYLAKEGVLREQTVRIIERCADNDSDPGAKITACHDTYDDLEASIDVAGWSGLKDICGLSDDDLATFGSIVSGRIAHSRRATPADAASVSSVSAIGKDIWRETPWPPMAELPAPVPSAPSMSQDMVSDPFRSRAVDIADLTKLPLEMVAVPMVAAAGSVVGRAVGVRPGQYDDFTVVANLWGGLVARPGWLKSTAISEAFNPLRRLAAESRSNHEVVEEELAVQRERINAEIAAIKTRMREDARKGLALSSLEKELAAKRVELKEATATERRFLTQDGTVEKLGELLRDNPRGMLVLRDELSGWLRGLDKAGREGDREFYLEGWNGTGSYTFDRIGRGTIHIPSLTLSLFGGIQPGKLESLIASAVHGGFGDDGLLQRLQLTVWPDRLPPWLKPTRYPDKDARENVAAIVESLASMDGISVGASNDDIPFLRFSPFAQSIADDWRDALEHRLRSDELDDTPAFASHIAKYRSLMPALALLFYLIDLATKVPGTSKGAITEQHVRLAIQWCAFLEAHARKLYAVELHSGVSAAHALATKIQAGAIFDGQSVRDLYRAQWAGLRTPERVLAGLTELTDLGWVRIEFALTGGRSSQVLRLHPDLRETGNAHEDGTDRTDTRVDEARNTHESGTGTTDRRVIRDSEDPWDGITEGVL